MNKQLFMSGYNEIALFQCAGILCVCAVKVTESIFTSEYARVCISLLFYTRRITETRTTTRRARIPSARAAHAPHREKGEKSEDRAQHMLYLQTSIYYQIINSPYNEACSALVQKGSLCKIYSVSRIIIGTTE